VVPELKDVLRDCCLGKAPWPLFLTGPVGTGKTCAALCVCDFVWEPLYYTIRDLVDRQALAYNRDLWSTDGSYRLTVHDVRSGLRNCALLVVDELARRERPSGSEADVVHLACSVREGRPFIAISNRTLSEISRIYDDAIASRLAAGTVFVLDGADRRIAPGTTEQAV